jgi:hypothetical protein
MTSFLKYEQVSGTASPLTRTRAKHNAVPSHGAVPESKETEVRTKRRLAMYTGTLIDDLMAAVERVEERTHEAMNAGDEKLAYRAPLPYELGPRDSNLLGVA